VLEESPDSACDVALQAASDLSVGAAFGPASFGVVACGLVVALAGEGNDVERVVELSVSAAVEAVSVLLLA
jgi:hypothetical protein